MSLKAELQTWSDALDAYERQDFEECISLFQLVADSSKIMFNIGVVQATMGRHEEAVQSFSTAVQLDPYLAVAYFQLGVSNFLLTNYSEAKRDFEDAFNNLRTNLTIDYEQIGLKFRLYSCEVLFNQGLCSIYTGNENEGMNYFSQAMKQKQTDEHRVIDEAFADRGDGYTVFSIPVGVLYRPPATKLRNLQTKNYLGTAKLVAATDTRDAFTGFTGSYHANRPAANSVDPFESKAPPGGLARSRTTAPRVEGSRVPLGRRPTENTATVRLNKDQGMTTPLSRSKALPPILPPINASSSNGLNGLPTPPPSEEVEGLNIPQPLATGYASNVRETAYGGADFLSYYEDEPVPPLPRAGVPPIPEGQPIDRVAKWARQNTAGAPPTSLSRSTSANESVPGNEKQRMPMMRSNTLAAAVGRAYAPSSVSRSGGGGGGLAYDDGYEGTVMSEREMTKVRVKLRYGDDTRGMSISPMMALVDFVERVRRKFESPSDLPMKYKDSDGTLVSIKDDDDWESALDEAREAAKGRAEGKVEIYLYDA